MSSSSVWPIDKTLSMAVAMKRYSAFPKISAFLEVYPLIISCHIRKLVGRVLSFCRTTVGVIYSHSRKARY